MSHLYKMTQVKFDEGFSADHYSIRFDPEAANDADMDPAYDVRLCIKGPNEDDDYICRPVGGYTSLQDALAACVDETETYINIQTVDGE